MERTEIFTAKTFDEAKMMAAEEFKADELDIRFEIIEQPKKGLFGTKGEFRVRAIYKESEAVAKPNPKAASTGKATTASEAAEEPITPVDPARFKHTIEYIEKILNGLGVKNYKIEVKSSGKNNILDISGDNLGIIIGRRGETLDALQYLSILANNRGEKEKGDENARLHLVIDCNGYREKRAETLEALANRTSNKVIKQGRRITLEPMNPYERRIIHSKVAEIDGVFSNSIGDEPYRKVVISAEVVKRRSFNNDRDRRGSNDNRGNRRNESHGRTDRDVIPERIPGAVSNAVESKSYKKSTGFSTSFEREYKRTESPAPEISQDTVDVEKNTSLYGKIEL
jgi:spoIIIJ-associated protein